MIDLSKQVSFVIVDEEWMGIWVELVRSGFRVQYSAVEVIETDEVQSHHKMTSCPPPPRPRPLHTRVVPLTRHAAAECPGQRCVFVEFVARESTAGLWVQPALNAGITPWRLKSR